jgi:antitoxin (DNA-binding transcriptional repressor) of toxin-antitoxin stability system
MVALELTVEEAALRFDEAAEAAIRGERVIVLKDGQPFVQMVAAADRGSSRSASGSGEPRQT